MNTWKRAAKLLALSALETASVGAFGYIFLIIAVNWQAAVGVLLVNHAANVEIWKRSWRYK